MDVFIRDSALNTHLPVGYTKGHEDPLGTIQTIDDKFVHLKFKDIKGAHSVSVQHWDSVHANPRKVTYLVSTAGGYWQISDFRDPLDRSGRLCIVRSKDNWMPHFVDDWEQEPYTAWDETIL